MNPLDDSDRERGEKPRGEISSFLGIGEDIEETDSKQTELLRNIFGDLLETACSPDRLKQYFRKPNATKDEDIMKYVRENRHQPSCFCRCMGTIGAYIACPCCFWRIVSPEDFMLISSSGYPDLRKDGVVRLESCRQSFKGTVKRNQEQIKFLDLNIVIVPKGMIGLAMYENKPIILGAGRHCYFNARFQLVKMTSLNEPFISLPPLSIFYVAKGAVGYGTQPNIGHPRIFGEGLHIIDEPGFKYLGEVNLNKDDQDIGQLHIVRIETGDVGIAYIDGKISILEPGIHLIIPPNRFDRRISTQQMVLALPNQVHESGDYVPLLIKSDVFFTIVDPLKAVTRIDNISKTIIETASATIAGIIRASTLQDIAKSSKTIHGSTAPAADPNASRPLLQNFMTPNGTTATDGNAGGGGGGSASEGPASFYAYVHDHFISLLHDDFINNWGIELQNIRIDCMSIVDKKLAQEISEQSLLYVTTQVQLTNLNYSKIIKDTEARRDAAVAVINAEAQKRIDELAAESVAIKTRIISSAEAEAKNIQANAYSKKTEILSKAQAECAVMLAEAEQKRLQLIGEGQHSFNDSINSSKFAPEYIALEKQTGALRGARKVYFSGDIPSFYGAGNTNVIPVGGAK